MMEALWISKTGLDAQQTRMSVISNNLANASTVGFKRGRAVFEDEIGRYCYPVDIHAAKADRASYEEYARDFKNLRYDWVDTASTLARRT